MKFKTRKVKFVWNKKLEGKKGYVANNINELIEIVEGDCCSELTTVTKSEHDAFPFKDETGYENRFFYPVKRSEQMTEEELIQSCIKSQRELRQKLIEEHRERISREEELDFVCFELYKELQEENDKLKKEKIPQLERKIASIRGAHSVDCRKLNARIEQVERLKNENTKLKSRISISVECDKAQKNGELCLGYGGDEDEPCEQCKNCIKCTTGYYQLGETEKDDKLTEAKGIIKTGLEGIKREFVVAGNKNPYKEEVIRLCNEYCEKAEAFLKE